MDDIQHLDDLTKDLSRMLQEGVESGFNQTTSQVDAFNHIVRLNQPFEDTGFLDSEELSADLHQRGHHERNQLGARALDSRSFAELKRNNKHLILSDSEQSLPICDSDGKPRSKINEAISEDDVSARNAPLNRQSLNQRSDISPLHASDTNPRKNPPNEPREVSHEISSRRNSKEI